MNKKHQTAALLSSPHFCSQLSLIVRRPIAAFVLLTASAATHASPVEVWECKDRFSLSGSILVTATVESGREEGNISVAGVTHAAAFKVAGFNRRWNFGLLPDRSNRYAFIIEPNGDATNFEFGNDGRARPSNFMTCRQVGAANAPK